MISHKEAVLQNGQGSDSTDMVNHPPHYKDESGIECIQVTRHMQFCGGNCFKYVYRAGKKGATIEDLEKAAKYAGWAFEIREKVCRYPSDLIKRVAAFREGDIKEAMLFVAEGDWAMVAHRINNEIARLEGNT